MTQLPEMERMRLEVKRRQAEDNLQKIQLRMIAINDIVTALEDAHEDAGEINFNSAVIFDEEHGFMHKIKELSDLTYQGLDYEPEDTQETEGN
jgi:hypothetical protein